jgi:hypothetical protein
VISNLDRYKAGIALLIERGKGLHNAIQAECYPEEFKKAAAKQGKKFADLLKSVPSFTDGYQKWYSEAAILVKQLLPDRLADFNKHYEKPKSRKIITHENYTIEDFLQGLRVTRSIGEQQEKIVGPESAIPRFRQQLAILDSVNARFESSLFDIRLLVQADLLDSELDAAQVLSKNKFVRAAGALAGVVLEKHLGQVCDNRNIKTAKKDPTISELNDALMKAQAIDIPQWRFVQHLADIRNLCDHNKKAEPTTDQVNDLILGVAKVTKTVF